MWSQNQQEIHPVELHELSLEELTGTRPSHRGTLMYLKQKGIPADAVHFREPERGHLKKYVQAVEHDFYTGPVTRHPEVRPPPGLQSLRVGAPQVEGPSTSRRQFHTPSNSGRAMSSRELMTGRRDGRAAALFQMMKDRSDQFVIDESTVPNPQQGIHGQGFVDRDRPWQKSPWEVAADHPMGLPNDAFQSPIPKPKPKPKLQNPAQVQKRGPPGYSEVDSIRQSQLAPKQGHKPVKIGCTWKGESGTTRFHSGVRPYQMDYNRTARGWNTGQGDDKSFSDNSYEDLDSWSTGRIDSKQPKKAASWDKGGGFNDFNTRPKSWIQEDDYRVPFQERPGNYHQSRQQRPGDVARQVVRAVIGPRAWADESDEL